MSTNVNAAHILGRITVKGRLQLASPLLIGEGASGEGRGDKDIHILRSKDGIPFIPATSLAGALRSFVEADEPRAAQILFGSMNERTSDAQESEGERQSAVSLYDVELADAVMGMRDGVHIDPVLGTAVAHGKYDYEIVESGAGGIFYAEIILRAVHEKDADILKKALTHLRDLLRGGFHVGALTTKGFGRMYLRDMEIDCYDFRDAKNVIAWLAPERGRATLHRTYGSDARPAPPPAAGDLIITADFALTGTSIKGVLRHRAAHILHALGTTQERIEDLIEELMGASPEQMQERAQTEKKRSRFIVEETLLNASPHAQTRIRCDRFTGGTISTALFSTQPVWQKKGEKAVTLTFGVKRMGTCSVQDWEAGLCILLLKELWLGRIAIGGEKSIGRGTLEGLHAVIHDRGTQYELTQGQPFDEKIMQTLQQYVTALSEEATR